MPMSAARGGAHARGFMPMSAARGGTRLHHLIALEQWATQL